ncbi:MAG: ClbS/DfsB family four-helix bundle protein [Actinomycetota bacterium]|nr:ClbS/DfsB family four-helix bundle protein [Actinomycetota bacterium]
MDDQTTEKRWTKSELLERIRNSRAALERAVDQAGEAALTADAPNGWTGKDYLAHIAAWEMSLVALLRGEPRYEAMGLDAATYESGDVDALNEALYTRDRALALPDVLLRFRRAHEQVIAEVDRLTDADLYKPYSAVQPDAPDNRDPIINWIAGNTFGHYDEHRLAIEALARSSS